jgi:hypothetical protein
VIRLPGDKARPAVVMRSDLLAEMAYATVLVITSDPRDDISMIANGVASHGRLASDSSAFRYERGDRPAQSGNHTIHHAATGRGVGHGVRYRPAAPAEGQ